MSSSGSNLRAETAATVRLALPITMIHVGTILMGTVDAMMLGRVSEVGLASVGIGNSLFFGLSTFFFGLLGALDPLVAQAYGAGDATRISRFAKQGIVIALAASIPVATIMLNARPFLRLLGQPPELVDGAARYLEASAFGVPAFLLYTALQRTLQSMSIVRPAFVAIVVANAANFLTDYVLVFGNWGFPALGAAGAGWATTVSRWVMVACVVGGAWKPLRRYFSIAAGDWRRFTSYASFWRIGAPIGAHVSLEFWIFGCVSLMMGNLGPLEAASHQVAINLASLAYMLALGLAEAAATRVGNAVGRRDMPGTRRAGYVSLGLGLSVMSFFAVLFLTLPQALTRLYSPDPEVVGLASVLLRIAAFFVFFDSTQAIATGILRGAADTRVPATMALVGYWLLGLPLGVALAYGAGMGPRGLWWGLTLGLSSVAVLLVVRVVGRFRGEIAAVE